MIVGARVLFFQQADDGVGCVLAIVQGPSWPAWVGARSSARSAADGWQVSISWAGR
jgi:hypothetical protein